MHEEVSDEAARLLMLSPVEVEATPDLPAAEDLSRRPSRRRGRSVSAAFGTRESKGEGTGGKDGPRDRAASFARHPGRRVHPRAGGRADAHGPPRRTRRSPRRRAPPTSPPPPPTPSGSARSSPPHPRIQKTSPRRAFLARPLVRVRRSRRMRRRADAPPRRRKRDSRRLRHRAARGGGGGEKWRAPPPRRPLFPRLSGAPGWRSTRTSRSPRCRSRCPATRRTTRSCSTPPRMRSLRTSRSRWRRSWPPRARPRRRPAWTTSGTCG